MKNLKTKKSNAIIICIVVIAVLCRVIFSAKSVAEIVSISKVDPTSVLITVFSAAAGEDFTQVFSSEDESDLEKFEAILSPAKAHLVEWRPLTGLVPKFDEDFVYSIFIKDDAEFRVLLDYSDGYVYYNNCKYRVSDEDIEAFEKGLKELCSEWKQ